MESTGRYCESYRANNVIVTGKQSNWLAGRPHAKAHSLAWLIFSWQVWHYFSRGHRRRLPGGCTGQFRSWWWLLFWIRVPAVESFCDLTLSKVMLLTDQRSMLLSLSAPLRSPRFCSHPALQPAPAPLQVVWVYRNWVWQISKCFSTASNTFWGILSLPT